MSVPRDWAGRAGRYVSLVSESDFYTVNDRYKAHSDASEWPTWELRAYGSAAPPDGPNGAPDLGTPSSPRPDPLAPWVSARLTFADGARIDVLVTVSDDAITVEDLRADPPLALDGFAALAHWIEGPLDDACRLATGRPRRPRPVPAPPATPRGESLTQAQTAALPEGERSPDPAPEPEPRPEPAQEHEAAGEAVAAGGIAAPAAAATYGAGELRAAPATDPADATSDTDPRVDTNNGPGVNSDISTNTNTNANSDTVTGTTASAGTAAVPEAGTPVATEPEAAAVVESAPDSAAVQGAVRVRGRERCKAAADAYRQAQRDGRDPVAAVMDATRRSRRRSLRLIAAARDAGFLAPRHNKR
ncbi:DUF6214 family protein [Streptomyces sp. SF28]|nr:DUF6214 family protein [Streptomyces pinistramenti]MCB5906241.1 DUF6214 family protein [Streptomyces pinistramenti]